MSEIAETKTPSLWLSIDVAAQLNVVDSSGWIEFFKAGPNGPAFRHVISLREQLLVPSVVLFEVCRVLDRQLSPRDSDACCEIMRLARVVQLDAQTAIDAARIGAKHKLAFGDAVIYASAQAHGARLWTQDADYEGLPGVQYLAKPSV